MKHPAIEAENVDDCDDIRILRRLLTSLERDAKIAIHLRFWENMTVQEIAFLLDMSWESTDQLIEKTIANLREKFQKIEMQRIFRVA